MFATFTIVLIGKLTTSFLGCDFFLSVSLINFLKTDDKELETKFDNLKEEVTGKLKSLKESSSDSETKQRIEETLEKVISEKYDKFTYFKIKNLNENI